jgi:hypothetical protein
VSVETATTKRVRVGRYRNAAMTLNWLPDAPPADASVEPITLATPDRAATSGLLYRPAQRPHGVVALCHPRVDCTSHYLIPPLLRAGYAVWAQRTRTTNNDLTAVHEHLLLDLAVAHIELEARELGPLFLIGNSGGASLYCFYVQQARLPATERLTDAPSGLPVDLTCDMPVPAGLILLAPHPGQGELLLNCIDPSVAEEGDALSVTPELDLFDAANGFRPAPQSSTYDDAFLTRYRAAQRARVERIDAHARTVIEHRAAARRRSREGDEDARRAALAPHFITVARTDADPRTVDLSLDPSQRDYGSIFGRRPDTTNYGSAGFGRLTTPDAWLSTWSGISSRASIHRTGPGVDVPSLVITYTADNSVFPSDGRAIHHALGAADKTLLDVEGDHYGFAPGTEERTGGRAAAAHIVAWLGAHTTDLDQGAPHS